MPPVAASLSVAASTLAWPAGRIPQEVLEIQENEARRIIADAIKVAEDSAESSDRPDTNSELFFGGPYQHSSTCPRGPNGGSRMSRANRETSPLARIGQHRRRAAGIRVV